jgi:hypothetical protein
MFAQQVISDLSKMSARYLPAKVEAFIPAIQSAQKFHFGSLEALPFSEDRREEIWPLAKTYWKAPFPTCWFDFYWTGEETGSVYKVGLLSLNDDKRSAINIFFSRKVWIWSVSFIMTRASGEEFPYTLELIKNPVQEYDDAQSGATWCNEFLRLLIILNCKNVEKVLIESPHRFVTKNGKRKKLPIFDYHILIIKDQKSGRKIYDSCQPVTAHNRVHLSRGHFKEYTADAPLFGKHTGIYWWAPSVRGQNRDGVVMKDYEVE